MTVTPSTGTLRAGETLPLQASSPGVKWSSNAPAVATVNGAGVVTGQGAGVVTITAKKGNQQARATITVQAAPPPPPVPEPIPEPPPTPEPPPGQPQPSPDGTEIPPAASIVAADGAVWTVASDLRTLRNGVHANDGNAHILLFLGGVIYAFGGGSWWRWAPSGWTDIGVTRPGASSPPPAPPPVVTPPPVIVVPPTPSPVPAGVLGPADFAYLGLFRVSHAIWDFSFSQAAMTGRRMPDGTIHLFMTGNFTGTQFQPTVNSVAEFIVPGTYGQTIATAPMAQPVPAGAGQWGDIYQGKRLTFRNGHQHDWGAVPGSHIIGSLLWREHPGSANGALYWQYWDWYNVTGERDHHLGMTVLNDGPSTQVAYGPWRTASPGVHKLGSYLTAMPDGTLGLGHGLSSGNISSSWGPMLRAGLAYPTPATPAGEHAPDLVVPDVYVEHFAAYQDLNGLTDGSVIPGRTIRSLLREGDYVWHLLGSFTGQPGASQGYMNPLTNNGQGSCTDADGYGPFVYIETPTKRGYLSVNAVAAGHVWYGPLDNCGHGIPTVFNPAGTGPNAERVRSSFFVYAPETFAAIKAGTRPSYTPPDVDFDPQVAIANFAMTPDKRVGGYWYEPISRLLFLAARNIDPVGVEFYPGVHVIQVT